MNEEKTQKLKEWINKEILEGQKLQKQARELNDNSGESFHKGRLEILHKVLANL